MTTPALTSYVLVLSYYDGSGVIGVWGPYETAADAEAGEEVLQQWPIEPGKWEIEPLWTPLPAFPDRTNP